MKYTITICRTLVVAVLVAGQASALAQQTPPEQSAIEQGSGALVAPATAFKKEEIEAILAPIALYPDALLAQIFMASTYPLEVVEAARWSKAHPDIKGDAVADAVKDQSWDLSVKSLVAFPDVLVMMDEKIDWTQKLGDAFLAQQKDVMESVQVLRNKAKETGNLKSSKEVTVKTEAAPANSPVPQTIIIESPDPEVIYVPTYNPTVVYGAWIYPAYPPYYYYPPGYMVGGAFWSFSVGVVVGGAIWGNCNWHGNDIDIDINNQNNFNRNEINHNRDNSGNRAGNTASDRAGNSNNRAGNSNDRAGNTSAGTKQSWNHDSAHRKGVGYRDSGTQQKYGKGVSQQNVRARENYRGYAEQSRQQIARDGVSNQRDTSNNRAGSRDVGGSTRDLSSSRDLGASSSNRSVSSSNRDFGSSSSRPSSRSSGSRSSDAFGRSGANSARTHSSRGSMSRGGGGGGRR
jgi:hypothetical protein